MSDKSTINKICSFYRDKHYSMSMIAERLEISLHKVQYWLEKNNIPRKDRSEAGYLAYMQRFNKLPCNIKKKLTSKQKELLIAGVMLYWAEGWKKNSQGVAFSNSEPKMIQLFLEFLREICGIQENRLSITLHLYEDQNKLKLKRYWSKITKVPLSQFNATYIHKGKPGTYKKKSIYGTASLRYYDKKLLNQILQWIDDYLNSFLKPT